MAGQSIHYKICKYNNKNQHTVISLRGRGKYFSLVNWE